jgi:Kdo2-lipid IVA lauroyltransferase/acyltransferase
MADFIFRLFFRMLSLLPLRVLHGMGALLGRMTYAFSPGYAARIRENLLQAGFRLDDEPGKKLLSKSIAEAGKGIMELPWIWGKPYEKVLGKVIECRGKEYFDAAQQGGSVIYLTPHFGCFELAGLYCAQHRPITILYRQPRLAWLEAVMCKGRGRGKAQLAKADLSGVRLLYKALKKGEAIGLLPDQVPGGGEGVWADFFGRPAYTMTLVGRLAEASNATLLMVSAERKAKGYVMHFEPLLLDYSRPVAEQINKTLEKIIRVCPEQYLWSYNRYKAPAGVEPPKKDA